MGRPTLTAKARGRSGCRGPFPGGDEASVVACFPSRGYAGARRGEGNRGMERSNWWNRGPPEGGNDPDLPAHRPPAVRNGHARPEHVT